MKQCTCCKEQKELSHFYKNKRRKDGHSSRCKTCDDVGNRSTRHNSPSQYRAYRKNWQDALFSRIDEWKRSKGCTCCPEKEPCTLELHHLDPTVKEDHPSNMRTSWKRFMEEASKCVLVCSNCHKKIHAGIIVL